MALWHPPVLALKGGQYLRYREVGTQYLPRHTLLAKALRKQASWHVITITALKSSQEHVPLTRKNSPVEKYNVTLQEGPERKKKNQTVMQEPLWHLKRWWHGLEGMRNPKEEVLCTKISQIQNQPD